ncbi:NUDIX hydrolase [Nocardioides sp.]|uniref:NUDIX hydrolase n=1 Tax=Nocardioides sp. TaxID=35761 RepID=UPI003D148B39
MDFDTRLAAYAVIVDTHDRVLLVLGNDTDPPQWALPGGGIDLAEDVPDGLVRELREETGYDVQPGVLLGVDTEVVAAAERLHDRSRPLKHVRIVHEASIVGGDLTHEVDGSTDEARWIPLGQVEALPRLGHVDLALDWWREYWGT